GAQLGQGVEQVAHRSVGDRLLAALPVAAGAFDLERARRRPVDLRAVDLVDLEARESAGAPVLGASPERIAEPRARGERLAFRTGVARRGLAVRRAPDHASELDPERLPAPGESDLDRPLLGRLETHLRRHRRSLDEAVCGEPRQVREESVHEIAVGAVGERALNPVHAVAPGEDDRGAPGRLESDPLDALPITREDLVIAPLSRLAQEIVPERIGHYVRRLLALEPDDPRAAGGHLGADLEDPLALG